MALALSFGEALFDCIDNKRHLGGAPLNFAWNLRQFGFPVAVVTAVGRDELGVEIRQYVERSGIDSSWITENDWPTGTVDVSLSDGEPTFTIAEDVAWDRIGVEGRPDEPPALFYYGTAALRSKHNREAWRSLLDFNPRSPLIYGGFRET